MHVRWGRLTLGLLSLGISGFLLLAGVYRVAEPAAVCFPGNVPESVPSDSPLASVVPPLERSSIHEQPRALREDDGLGASLAQERSATPRKEREFLAGFLALENARPGALEERAQAVLSGNGPGAEKVALLRALERSGSDQLLAWLEHAASARPEDSGPQGAAVARYALGRLVETALADEGARPILRRLAFETRTVAPDLRRSAALGLAHSAGEADVGALHVALARETDVVLVAGVAEALRERSDLPQAGRLLETCAAAGWTPASTQN
jgi:hypothetical protein